MQNLPLLFSKPLHPIPLMNLRLAEWNDDQVSYLLPCETGYLIHTVKGINDYCVTFLSLHSFDPFNSHCWLCLAQDIQEWLITIVIDSHSQEWTWGHELFWMVFIATYPMFP